MADDVETPLPRAAAVETPLPKAAPVETPLPKAAPVGTPLPKAAAVETPLPKAVAVVVRRGERFLLIQRALHKPLGGYWTPVTGRLEAGESLEETCHREVAEEVGLAIELGPSFHAGTTSDGRFALTYFTAEAPIGELALQAEEVANARWVSLAEVDAGVLQPMLPTTRAVLAKLR